MQTTTTVRFRRNSSPIMGVLGAIVALCIVGSSFFAPQGALAPQSGSQIAKKAVAQPVYQELAQADKLFCAGQTESAGVILDAERSVDLIISAGGYGEGSMVGDSPTSLLMRLTRKMQNAAMQALNTQDTDTALLWVARLHSMAHQTLHNSTPTLDSVRLAYKTISAALQTETQVWERIGDTARADRAKARGQRIVAFWTQRIQPELDSLRCAEDNNPQKASIAVQEEQETHCAEQMVREIRAVVG